MNMFSMYGSIVPDFFGHHQSDSAPILAMARVTPQPEITHAPVYTAMEGLKNGTLFPELYKPFTGRPKSGERHG